MEENRKEGRPGDLEETIDLELPQDSGIPNREEEERDDPDSTPAPGSRPPPSEREDDRPDDETVRA